MSYESWLMASHSQLYDKVATTTNLNLAGGLISSIPPNLRQRL